MSDIEKIINEAWEIKDQINKNSGKSIIDTINQIIEDLDQGKKRVAEKINGKWTTHQYIKKAVMLSFRIHEMEALTGPYSSWYDKAHLLKGKTSNWKKNDFEVIRKFSDKLVSKSLELGGTITGEHGIGLNKKDYLSLEHKDSLPLMKALKKTIDPNNIMNPGKIFDL